MKVFCYFILVVAFLMYYQQNPVYTIVIIGIGIGLYIFFKSRKGKSGMITKFFSGRNEIESTSRVDDLILLFMVQQMFNDSNRTKPQQDKKNEKHEKIDEVKQEILDLLEEK